MYYRILLKQCKKLQEFEWIHYWSLKEKIRVSLLVESPCIYICVNEFVYHSGKRMINLYLSIKQSVYSNNTYRRSRTFTAVTLLKKYIIMWLTFTIIIWWEQIILSKCYNLIKYMNYILTIFQFLNKLWALENCKNVQFKMLITCYKSKILKKSLCGALDNILIFKFYGSLINYGVKITAE